MNGTRPRKAKGSISATALSELAICQEMVALRQSLGSVTPTAEHARRLARGKVMHAASERAARNAAQGRKGACFIATAVYGPEHPSTQRLRVLRDRVLRTTRVGRYLVATYYRASPPIAGYLQRHPWARVIAQCGLDGFLRLWGIVSESTRDSDAGTRR